MSTFSLNVFFLNVLLSFIIYAATQFPLRSSMNLSPFELWLKLVADLAASCENTVPQR